MKKRACKSHRFTDAGLFKHVNIKKTQNMSPHFNTIQISLCEAANRSQPRGGGL